VRIYGHILAHKSHLQIVGVFTEIFACQVTRHPDASMTTKNDYGQPEFVTKLSEWRPEIFFYPDAEIYSFPILWVDFPKLPLKMAINIKLFK
jgi:hypothetical protein